MGRGRKGPSDQRNQKQKFAKTMKEKKRSGGVLMCRMMIIENNNYSYQRMLLTS